MELIHRFKMTLRLEITEKKLVKRPISYFLDTNLDLRFL